MKQNKKLLYQSEISQKKSLHIYYGKKKFTVRPVFHKCGRSLGVMVWKPDDQRPSHWWLRLDTQSHGGVAGPGERRGARHMVASCARELTEGSVELPHLAVTESPAAVSASLPPSRFHMSSCHGKTLTCTRMSKEFPDAFPLNAWHCPGALWGQLRVPCQHLTGALWRPCSMLWRENIKSEKL